MSLFLRPAGDEVASIYGPYFTARQITCIQAGERLDVLCTDGLNYIVVVKEYDKDADYGVLHFDKWSSKWDYKGPFINLYIAKNGRYTDKISSRNNYAHLTLNVEQEKDKDKDKDKIKAVHQFQSGTKYPDNYFEKPRLDGASRRRRIIDDNDQDADASHGAKVPSLTLKLKSSKAKGSFALHLASDRYRGGDVSSDGDDIANSSDDDVHTRRAGEKRRKLSRVPSNGGSGGSEGTSKRKYTQGGRGNAAAMMSSSEYIASLSKLSNASLLKLGISDISELSEANMSNAMLLYLNHCHQFEILRGNLEIEESLKGVNRSLKIVKSVIKSSGMKEADSRDEDEDENEEPERPGQEASETGVVPPYLVLKYSQLMELLEAKKCIELMISDIIK
jgi:hypothetical protein